MRLLFAVLVLFVAYCASYPAASGNDLDLELRSLLHQLNEEQDAPQAWESDESDESDDEDFEISKRGAGGHDMVDKQSKCEIQCIHKHRFPGKGAKGKTVKAAAKVCRNECPNTKPINKKPVGPKVPPSPPRGRHNLREFIDDEIDANEQQQEYERRQLYDYLLAQLEEN